MSFLFNTTFFFNYLSKESVVKDCVEFRKGRLEKIERGEFGCGDVKRGLRQLFDQLSGKNKS